MSYILTKRQEATIARLSKSGRYNNKSEVVRAAINLMEDLERENARAVGESLVKDAKVLLADATKAVRGFRRPGASAKQNSREEGGKSPQGQSPDASPILTRYALAGKNKRSR